MHKMRWNCPYITNSPPKKYHHFIFLFIFAWHWFCILLGVNFHSHWTKWMNASAQWINIWYLHLKPVEVHWVHKQMQLLFIDAYKIG